MACAPPRKNTASEDLYICMDRTTIRKNMDGDRHKGTPGMHGHTPPG